MNGETKRFYEFDNFRVDTNQKCLWYGSELVSLTPKAFDTLVVLVESKGNIVDKDSLLNRVWADTFVEESSLTQNISTLRRTFASLQSGKQFIETVPRRGYRFVCDVREIIEDEEILIVEKHARTEILAEQEIIRESDSRKSFLTKKRLFLFACAFASMVLLACVVAGLSYLLRPKPLAEEKFKQIRISKLTSSGDIRRIAMSPDGKYIAMVSVAGDKQKLILRQSYTENNVDITPLSKSNYVGVVFSPDNSSIFYTVFTKETLYGFLYKIPLLGGTPQQIIKDVDSPISFSPDGERFAFIRGLPEKRESALMIANIDGTNEQRLSSVFFPDFFAYEGLAWSPDGQVIVCVVDNFEEQSDAKIVAIQVKDGSQKLIPEQKWKRVGQLAWLKDGSGLVFPAVSCNSNNLSEEIWIASYPDGKIRQITTGINGFYDLSINQSLNTIISVQSNRVANFWVAPAKDFSKVTRITQGAGHRFSDGIGMTWTPDNKIIYAAITNDNTDLWIMNADGSNQKQLVNDPISADMEPAVSPDGRYIVFASHRLGKRTLWRMNSDGTNLIQITNGETDSCPNISPDGNWIIYSSKNKFRVTLQKVSIDGSQPVQVTEKLAVWLTLSPDGKYIACYFPDPDTGEMRLTILSSLDATIVRQFGEVTPETTTELHWTYDGSAITYIVTHNGVSNIWAQPIDGSAPRQITDWKSDRIFRFAWSPDGQFLACERGIAINDIVLIEDASIEN